MSKNMKEIPSVEENTEADVDADADAVGDNDNQ